MNEKRQSYKISIISVQESPRDYLENEHSPDNQDEENNPGLGSEFKGFGTDSSFQALNTDLLDYPPIVFDDEVVSWDKIIRENILQPFLPKNKLILQSLLKGLKNDGQRENFDYESAIKRKSNLLAGDAGNAEQIGKRLHEFRKKMEKKVRIVSPKSRPDYARGFEVRSIDRINNLLRKKQALDREERKADIVNKRYYDLDTSLKDLRKDADFFKLYELEQELEPVEEPKKLKPQKNHRGSDYGHLRVQTPSSITSISHSHYKSDIPGSSSSTRHSLPLEEPLISKKHVRRKSCFCTLCGGLSIFEKHTLDICGPKTVRAGIRKLHPTSNTQSLQPDSIFLSALDKMQPRVRKENSMANFSKLLNKDKGGDSHQDLKPQALRSSRNLFDAERRKSAFFDFGSNPIGKILQSKSRMNQAEAPKATNESQPDHARFSPAHNSPLITAIIPGGSGNSAANKIYQSILDVSLDVGAPGNEKPEDGHSKSTSKGDAIANNSSKPTKVKLTPILAAVPKKQKTKKRDVKRMGTQENFKLDKTTGFERVNSPTNHLSEKQSHSHVSRVRFVKSRQGSRTIVESALVSSDIQQSIIRDKTLTEIQELGQKKSPKAASSTTIHKRNFTIGSPSGLKSILSPREILEKKKIETIEENVPLLPPKQTLQLRTPEEINKIYMQANKHLLASSAMYNRPRVNSPTPSLSATTTKWTPVSPRSILNTSPYFSPRPHQSRGSLMGQDLKLNALPVNHNRLISSPQPHQSRV